MQQYIIKIHHIISKHQHYKELNKQLKNLILILIMMYIQHMVIMMIQNYHLGIIFHKFLNIIVNIMIFTQIYLLKLMISIACLLKYNLLNNLILIHYLNILQYIKIFQKDLILVLYLLDQMIIHYHIMYKKNLLYQKEVQIFIINHQIMYHLL